MSKTLLDEKIDKVQDLVDIQCSCGNYDYDPYMHGMANGMIVILSVLTGQDPELVDAPDKWRSSFSEPPVCVSSDENTNSREFD